jgi:hypothetical protein
MQMERTPWAEAPSMVNITGLMVWNQRYATSMAHTARPVESVRRVPSQWRMPKTTKRTAPMMWAR